MLGTRMMTSRRLAPTCFFVAFALLLAAPQAAWANGTADVAATALNDKVMIDSEAFYLTYNDDAPNLVQSDMAPDDTWVFWGIEPKTALSDTLNFYTKTKASNNRSAGSRISATYRNVGWLHSTGDPTWSEAVDIKVTIQVTKSEGNPFYLSGEGWWNDWCDIQFHQRLVDGWTTTNMPEFDMTVEFYRAGTASKLDLNGSIWVLGQSLDEGEGFMVKNARAGYVSSDAPVSNPDSGAVHPAVSPDSMRHSIPGSHLYEIGSIGSGWYGFMGAPVIYSADTTRWVQARDMNVYDDGWWWQRKHGLNYIDRNGQGVDLETRDTNSNRTSWKQLDSALVENSFKWRSGALEAQMTGGTVQIKHFAIMKPDSSPSAANASYGFGSAGMAADGSWDVRYASDLNNAFATWGTYGYKYFTQLFAPQTAFVPSKPTKAVDKERAEVGEVLTYTVRQKVNEHGADCADGYTYRSLVFDDILPEGLSFGTISIIDPAGNEVTGSGGTLSVGEDNRTLSFAFDKTYLMNTLPYEGGYFTVTITASILPQAANTTLVNGASFTFNDNYRLESNEVETVVPMPDVEIPIPEKAVDKDEAEVGETITYTIREHVADFEGYRYDSLVFTDTLPNGLAFKSLKVEADGGTRNGRSTNDVTSSAGTKAVSGQTVSYAFSDEFLSGGGLTYTDDILTFTIVATIDDSAAGTTLENEASIIVNDSELKTNRVITRVPTLQIPAPVKAVDKAEANPGETIVYTITQSLDEFPSSYALASIVFDDELPEGLTYTSLSVFDPASEDITSSAGTTLVEGQRVTFSFDLDWLESKRPLEGSLVFRITGQIDSGDPSSYGGLLVNEANVTFNERYRKTTNQVETRVKTPPVLPVALPLTGQAGNTALLNLCMIAVASGVTGLAVNLLRSRRRRS